MKHFIAPDGYKFCNGNVIMKELFLSDKTDVNKYQLIPNSKALSISRNQKKELVKQITPKEVDDFISKILESEKVIRQN